MVKYTTWRSSGYTLLLVDDNEEFLRATRKLLEHEGHLVISASSGPAALEVLASEQVDLVLLDYILPEMEADEVITQLRQFNPVVPVLLQTGFADERPATEMLRKLPIQGFIDKSKGPQEMLLWVAATLKHFGTIQGLQAERNSLRVILDAALDLAGVGTRDALAECLLAKVPGLLALLAAPCEAPPVVSDFFMALVDETGKPQIVAGRGRFADQRDMSACLSPPAQDGLDRALTDGSSRSAPAEAVVPLRAKGHKPMGVIYLEGVKLNDRAREALEAFAGHAAMALRHVVQDVV
jgi:CheY-like chemotaxis protein